MAEKVNTLYSKKAKF